MKCFVERNVLDLRFKNVINFKFMKANTSSKQHIKDNAKHVYLNSNITIKQINESFAQALKIVEQQDVKR